VIYDSVLNLRIEASIHSLEPAVIVPAQDDEMIHENVIMDQQS
jgi:hypothetical protein